MASPIRNTITAISRRLHCMYWRVCHRTDKYVQMQTSSSHNTRESEINQENILIALEELFLSLPDKSSRILDAGCGDGWTLEQMKKRGYSDLWGIDINEEKIAAAKSHGNANVSRALLPDLTYENSFFEAVFCRHVYEHLLYPERTLNAFFRVLRPGGLLFLIAPRTEINAEVNESHIVKIQASSDISDVVKKQGFLVVDVQQHQLEDFEFWIIARKPEDA